MARDVGQHGQGRGCNDDAPYGQSIQAISQVHGVRRTHHHQDYKKQKRHEGERVGPDSRQKAGYQEIGPEALEEGNGQGCRVEAARRKENQHHAKYKAHQDLEQELGPPGETQVLMLADLLVVIPESDGGQGPGHPQNQPYKNVTQISP